MKTLFIQDIKTGQDIDAAFLILSCSQGRSSRGGVYLNVELGDRTGRVSAKVWDGALGLSTVLTEGRVATVRGYADSFRGAAQVVIREAAPAMEADFDWADFLRASPFSPDLMLGELWSMVDGIGDSDFRELVSAALRHKAVAEAFYIMPAAKNMHHAYLHGLLEHSLSVARLAKAVGALYPAVNADLLHTAPGG